MSIDFDLPMFVFLLLVTTPEVSVGVLDVQIGSTLLPTTIPDHNFGEFAGLSGNLL